MKKRMLGIFLTAFLGIALFAGCGSSQQPEGSMAAQEATDEQQMASSAETEASVSEETALPDLSGQTLMIYCGAGMQQPFQEIADAFQAETNCEMNVSFANAAQIQTQISESQEGAFFIAGSGEEVKPVSDYVSSSQDLVKHIPVLAVATDNPKGITGLSDLANEDIVTVIGDPESTPIGKIAMKAFSDFGITDSVNLAATTTTAPQLATVVGMGEADAAIIWKENCNADGVEICDTTDMDAYVKTIPAARLNFETDSEAADVFETFLQSEEAQQIWISYGYELAE